MLTKKGKQNVKIYIYFYYQFFYVLCLVIPAFLNHSKLYRARRMNIADICARQETSITLIITIYLLILITYLFYDYSCIRLTEFGTWKGTWTSNLENSWTCWNHGDFIKEVEGFGGRLYHKKLNKSLVSMFKSINNIIHIL